MEFILVRTICVEKLSLTNKMKFVVDWPAIPRIGETVFIKPFGDECDYEPIVVRNVIHNFYEGKIEVELENYQMPDEKSKELVKELVNKCHENGWVWYHSDL